MALSDPIKGFLYLLRLFVHYRVKNYIGTNDVILVAITTAQKVLD